MSKVALIEDDEKTSNTYSEMLRGAGIEVDQYLTTESAIEGIDKNDYDGYLLDLEMNHISYDGLSIVPIIQNKLDSFTNFRKPIPILIVSGHPANEYKAISQNFFTPWDHLEKPIEPLTNLVSMTKMLIRFANEEYSYNSEKIKNNCLIIKNGVEVYWKNRRVLGLAMTLFKFLQCLLRKGDEGATFKELHDLTNSYETDIYKQKQAVRVHIKRLRDTFKDIDPSFDKIEPIFGKGYKWSN